MKSFLVIFGVLAAGYFAWKKYQQRKQAAKLANDFVNRLLW